MCISHTVFGHGGMLSFLTDLSFIPSYKNRNMVAWNIAHKQLLVILSKWKAILKLRYCTVHILVIKSSLENKVCVCFLLVPMHANDILALTENQSFSICNYIGDY